MFNGAKIDSNENSEISEEKKCPGRGRPKKYNAISRTAHHTGGKRGRPRSAPAPTKKRQKKRKLSNPTPHPAFRGKGTVRTEGRGYIKGFYDGSMRLLPLWWYALFFCLTIPGFRNIANESLGFEPPERVEEFDPFEEEYFDQITKFIRRDKALSLSKIKIKLEQQGIVLSRSKIWRTLKDKGWCYKVRRSRPFCGPKGVTFWKKMRLKFAREWKNFDYRRFVFVDECILRCLDGRKFEWCSKAEKPTVRRNPRWTASCHVFGAIAHGGFRFIYDVNSYRGDPQAGVRGGFTAANYKDLLENHFLPALSQHFDQLNARLPEDKKIKPIIVQDGAPVHKSRAVRKAFADAGFEVVENWPGYSPDLNCIENCWGLAKHDLQADLLLDQRNTEANRRRLFNLTRRYFDAYPTEKINKLIQSFPKRLEIVRKLRGDYSGY